MTSTTWARPRTALIGGALAAVVVAAVVGVALAGSPGADGAGPVGFGYDGEYTASISDVKPGEVLTYGQIVLENSADEPARLLSVELVGDTDGVEVGPVLVAGLDRQVGAGGLQRGAFPPDLGWGTPLVPLDRAEVPPHSDVGVDGQPALGVNLLVRVVVSDGTVHRFTGTRVRYRVGEREYVYTDPVDLALCPTKECPVG